MANLNSINPFNGKKIGSVKSATKKDITEAVKKARRAFLIWRDIPVEKRIIYVKKSTNEIIKRKKKIAEIITLEMGKPYREALGEIEFSCRSLKYYITEAPRFLQTKIIRADSPFRQKGEITFEPYGVCAVITPWNFPLALPISGIIPNILVGNTVIFKPSEQTSLCGKMIIEILESAGLPMGVANIVYGGKKSGKALADSPVSLIWFTGSSKVGQEIYKKCGQRFIHCVLELGGSSPAIVFADADLDKAVRNIILSRFSNAGQICNATKRLFVEESIFPLFVKKLISEIANMKIGDPFSGVDIAPLSSKKQLNLLLAQFNDAIKKGASVLIGGKRPADKKLKKGNFFLPTIVSNVNFNMRLMKEEVFGPILPVMSFKKISQAVEMANDTPYGLSAEIYTSDARKAEYLVKKLNVGWVSVNSYCYFPPAAPYGGYKMSGIGRQGGEFGFRDLCQIKYVNKSN